MAKAVWNGVTVAESDACIEVEGNQYFPIDDVRAEYLQPSGTTTFCSWKGTASYYDIVVDGRTNKDAAWYYPTPMDAAHNIKGYVAFWRGVEVG